MRNSLGEPRRFCRCELCRLQYGRMLYPKRSGEPLGWGRIKGFGGNFSIAWVKARWSHWSHRRPHNGRGVFYYWTR